MGRKNKPRISERSGLKDLTVTPDKAAKAKGGNTSVGNVLKTRHDTSKNSINNVR
jgi:hypothetical protein